MTLELTLAQAGLLQSVLATRIKIEQAMLGLTQITEDEAAEKRQLLNDLRVLAGRVDRL